MYLALSQLGPGPGDLDTSPQRGADGARPGAGPLAQSGWSAARKPDTTEGHAQGTEKKSSRLFSRHYHHIAVCAHVINALIVIKSVLYHLHCILYLTVHY